MRPELEAAIEGLYEAFEAPKPRYIDRCPCCGDRKVVRNPEKALRDLTVDDLDMYASALFSTVGGVADFKYYLPRMFELAATDADWDVADFTMMRHLRSAEWKKWPKLEQMAVEAFFKVWFVTLLDRTPEYPGEIVMGKAESFLRALPKAEVSVEPYFKLILRNPAALMQIYSENEMAMTDESLVETYPWESDKEVIALFMDFLRSKEVEAVLYA